MPFTTLGEYDLSHNSGYIQGPGPCPPKLNEEYAAFRVQLSLRGRLEANRHRETRKVGELELCLNVMLLSQLL